MLKIELYSQFVSYWFAHLMKFWFNILKRVMSNVVLVHSEALKI